MISSAYICYMKTLENVVVLSLEDYEQLMRNQKNEELEVGKWYWVDRNGYVTNDSKALAFFQGQGIQTFGFSHDGNYTVNYGMINTFKNPKYTYTKATNLEVFEFLKKHALSLGFDGHFSFTQVEPTLFKCDGVIIFNNGIWDKPKPKIDYSRLKTGSVVKIKYTGQHCAGIEGFDLNRPVTILLYKTNGIYWNGEYKLTERPYTTFVQGKNTSHFTTYNENYITEVISY